jgi:hypothetical protein
MPKGQYIRTHTVVPPPVILRPILTPIGPSISYVPLTKGQFAKIASFEAERVGTRNWCAKWCPGSHYRAFGEVEGKSVSLHAFLLGTGTGYAVTADHVVPGDALNCLPHNLRIASASQQASNRRKFKNNSSGYKGVVKIGQRWRAVIHFRKVRTHIGYFSSPELAAQAYEGAAKRIHGEYRCIH